MKYRFLSLSLLLFIILFSGCGNDAVAKTKELNKNIAQKNVTTIQESPKERILKIDYKNKIALQELANRSKEQLAIINAKNQQKLKTLEIERAKSIATQKTKQEAIEANKSVLLAQISQKTLIVKKEKELSLYKILAFLLLFSLIIWLILRYINQQAKRKHEVYLKEQAYNFEAYKQESEMKHKNINKMLDIISDEKSDPAIKKEITKILSHNKSSLIEHKKR